MVKVTVSSSLDYDIAIKLESEAIERDMTISQLIRSIITDKYKTNVR